MLIGIIGAPNKGKSTLFSALTTVDVAIADYPFTTIKPNFGVAYVTSKCPDTELGVKCNPRNSICVNGTRLVPVNVIDIAGLVPGAHLGKGMGNQFLNDLIGADVLIQVVDASGKTDMNGNACEDCDPAEEVKMVSDELAYWVSEIIKRHMGAVAKRSDGAEALAEVLAGFRISVGEIERAADAAGLPLSGISWNDDDTLAFSRELLRRSKPVIVAANKLDKAENGMLDRIAKELPGYTVIGCSAAIELALRKAAKSGVIGYTPGSRSFTISGSVTSEQRRALDYMADFISKNGTGVQELINTAVFTVLKMIVVYPVEDENKYSDHFGNVLPDVILMPQGSTALDLAAHIHTEIAKGMLYAIDARKKMRVGKGYVLKNNDIIKIVSAAH